MDKNELTDGDKTLLSDIESVGWHVLKVLEDEKGPGFAYSVGLFKTYQHPEIIIIGLKLDLAHLLINNISEEVKKGKRYQPEQLYTDILDDFKCLMLNVHKEHYHQYVGYVKWYYAGNNFPLMQCLYPTVKGIYPWENEWPEDLRNLQPILGDIDKVDRE